MISLITTVLQLVLEIIKLRNQWTAEQKATKDQQIKEYLDGMIKAVTSTQEQNDEAAKAKLGAIE